MTNDQREERERIALRVREHVIRMATGGGCFIGASLSCVDLLVSLYVDVLGILPDTIGDPNRDYLLLSKGHDVPALYGVLAELGFFDTARLSNHLKTSDDVYWHPHRALPGVEFHSGSLGHLLSVGIGIAYDIAITGRSNRVFVVCGDGELNEGSMWEGILVAHARGLRNLTLVVDRNGFQANLPTEELNPLEPLEEKFKAFGWTTVRTNGHSFEALEKAFSDLDSRDSGPAVLIADTVRGKGLPSIERRADRWFANFSPEEIVMLLEELHEGAQSAIYSEPMCVR
jgi:transketolase